MKISNNKMATIILYGLNESISSCLSLIMNEIIKTKLIKAGKILSQ